jgi:hypothetical protein
MQFSGDTAQQPYTGRNHLLWYNSKAQERFCRHYLDPLSGDWTPKSIPDLLSPLSFERLYLGELYGWLLG